MRPFRNLSAALAEAEYLAVDTGRRFAVVHARFEHYGVIELSKAYEHNLQILEVIRP